MHNKLVTLILTLVIGLGSVGLLLGVVSHQAQASLSVSNWTQVNTNGFGDPLNKDIPAMTVFDDYLYAGVWHADPVTTTGQIWRTSTGQDWQMVDERPVSNVSALTAFDGLIYASSFNGNIWRSADGLDWTDVITDGFGDPSNFFSRFAVYSDTLFLGTWNYSTGAEIWRSSDGSDWSQVVDTGLGDPNNVAINTSAVFNGDLYWGLYNHTTQAEIWRTDGITTTQVITSGFGNIENFAISSLEVFNNYLYAGVQNIHNVQVWRTHNGTDWEHVVDGLGSTLVSQKNSLEVYDGRLYLEMQDFDHGLQVWRSSDGIHWEQVGFDGFGDMYNNLPDNDNAFTTFNGRLYISTQNSSGGEIWQMSAEYKTFLPIIAAPCKPLYYDNFSDPSSGWPIVETNNVRFQYVNGEYQILVKPANYYAYTYGDFAGNPFRYEVDARPAGQSDGAVGLMFNASDDGFYLFNVYQNWYTLWRYDAAGELWTQLIDWYQSPALRTGTQSNHLEVIRNGIFIYLKANGQDLMGIADITHLGPGLGMESEAWSANFDARFDNFTVWSGCGVSTSSVAPQFHYFSYPRVPDSLP